MTQVASPISDVSNVNWAPAPLYPHIGAPQPDDSDPISTPVPPGGVFQVQLAPAARPITGTHTLTVRFNKSDPCPALVTFSLLQGGQTIAARSVEPTQPFTDYDLVLTEQEVDLITDYTSLVLQVLAGGGGSGSGSPCSGSWGSPSGSLSGPSGGGSGSGSGSGSVGSGSAASGSAGSGFSGSFTGSFGSTSGASGSPASGPTGSPGSGSGVSGSSGSGGSGSGSSGSSGSGASGSASGLSGSAASGSQSGSMGSQGSASGASGSVESAGSPSGQSGSQSGASGSGSGAPCCGYPPTVTATLSGVISGTITLAFDGDHSWTGTIGAPCGTGPMAVALACGVATGVWQVGIEGNDCGNNQPSYAPPGTYSCNPLYIPFTVGLVCGDPTNPCNGQNVTVVITP